jgi:transposase
MVLLGVDPHKDTHTVVAVDQAGRQLDQTTVPARSLGHGELVGWARTLARPRPTELGGGGLPARHWPAGTRPAGCGERALRVPPRLMAGARQAVRTQGKSDPIDALAVAGRPCASPPSRSPSTTRPPGRSSCWSTIASAWSPNAPGRQPAALSPAPAGP